MKIEFQDAAYTLVPGDYRPGAETIEINALTELSQLMEERGWVHVALGRPTIEARLEGVGLVGFYMRRP